MYDKYLVSDDGLHDQKYWLPTKYIETTIIVCFNLDWSIIIAGVRECPKRLKLRREDSGISSKSKFVKL